MYILSEKDYAEQSAFKSVNNFFHFFAVGKALKRAGVYKTKGIQAMNIMLYLTFLVYSGKTMNRDATGKNPVIGNSKDAVYRLLRCQRVNWSSFLLAVSEKAIAFTEKLTSETRKTAFVIDDTLYERPFSKKTELIAKVYDHVDKRYTRGFRTLFLSWTDGASLIPVCFRHLSSTDPKNRLVSEREGRDKRTCAVRAKREAVMKAPDVCLKLLAKAKHFGIHADYVLFDSWFAFPSVITKIKGMGYDVTARVKNSAKVRYLYDGRALPLKVIYDRSKKRRGKSRYLLSVDINLINDGEPGIPCRLVYVRNRGNRKDWIAILTTDMDLTPEDVLTLYGKRWSIEVFLKTCKTYLRFTGEFQQVSYEAITAHTTIVALRYMILSVEQRKRTDYRALGELFYDATDEAAELTFHEVLMMIMASLTSALTRGSVALDEDAARDFMAAFIGGLPPFVQRLLAPDLVASQQPI